MASSTSDIKRRIGSIQSTSKITKAMELVATSRIGPAVAKAEHADYYFKCIYDLLWDISPFIDRNIFISENTNQHKKENPTKCVVVIGGDRGFAGGFYANLSKAVEEFVRKETGPPALAPSENAKPPSAKHSFCFLPIGRKMNDALSRDKRDIISQQYRNEENLRLKDANHIADFLISEFKANHFDELYILFTYYTSMLDFAPLTLKALPFDVSSAQAKTHKGSVLIEPNAGSVWEKSVRQYLSGLIFGALCHSRAAELSARKMAMNSANKNAKEMLENLHIKYNRIRQELITNEMAEIASASDLV